jgi:hypothetical protein
MNDMKYKIGDKLIRKANVERIDKYRTDSLDTYKSITVVGFNLNVIKCISDVRYGCSIEMPFAIVDEEYDKVTDEKKPLKLKDLL